MEGRQCALEAARGGGREGALTGARLKVHFLCPRPPAARSCGGVLLGGAAARRGHLQGGRWLDFPAAMHSGGMPGGPPKMLPERTGLAAFPAAGGGGGGPVGCSTGLEGIAAVAAAGWCTAGPKARLAPSAPIGAVSLPNRRLRGILWGVHGDPARLRGRGAGTGPIPGRAITAEGCLWLCCRPLCSPRLPICAPGWGCSAAEPSLWGGRSGSPAATRAGRGPQAAGQKVT